MKIHLIKFIKYSATILIFYNIFSLVVLFTSNYSIKSTFWKLAPYDYKQIMEFPNHYEKLSLRNSSNRNKINDLLNKNINKNILDVEFWNYKLILDNFSKKKNSEYFHNIYDALIPLKQMIEKRDKEVERLKEGYDSAVKQKIILKLFDLKERIEFYSDESNNNDSSVNITEEVVLSSKSILKVLEYLLKFI